RLLARVSDRIVTISPRQRSDIVERFRIAPAARVEMIPLGINLAGLLATTAASPNLRSELGLDARDIVVGFVGRLVPIKDPQTLVRAFAVARARDARLQLLVAGGGQLRPDLERLAEELGVGRQVRFLGWTDRLELLYSTMDLCALSSINEGTPVALIEAMAAGRAVVATAVGGVADLVEDGVQGRLVPSRDVQALATAMIGLAERPDERARMGAAGRARVARAYASERLVDEVEGLYERVVRERRGRV
ncbi:MAG: glycosyltransferase, partial [Vicinamibacterales bacterium]